MFKSKACSFLLATCIGVTLFTFSTFAKNIEVNSSQELQNAIYNSNGTKENPTIIEIRQDIEITETIIIPARKHVQLVAPEDKNVTLKRSKEFKSAFFDIKEYSDLKLGSGDEEAGLFTVSTKGGYMIKEVGDLNFILKYGATLEI